MAEQNSTQLLQDVRKVLDQVQGGVEESLKDTNNELSKVSNVKMQINERENELLK